MEDATSDFWISLLKAESGSFFGTIAGGVLKGVGLSFILILVIYFAYKALKLLPKKGGGAAKILTLAWLFITLPIAGGFIGFHQSLERAVQRLMTEGQFATEVMPELSIAISDFVFLVDQQLAKTLDEDIDPDEDHLNVVTFQSRLARMQDEWVQGVLTESTADVRAKYPFLNEGIPKQVFDGFVSFFGEKVLKSQVSSAAEKVGIQFPMTMWLEGLPEAAAMTGASDDLSREELSSYTVQTLLTAFFLKPMSSLLKVQKTLGLMAWLGIVLFPALLLWIYKRFSKKPEY